MDENLQSIAAGIIRHGLTTAGGYLMASGVIHGQGGVQAFVAAGMVIIGVAWSYWQKVGQAKAMAELAKVSSLVKK